MTSQRELRARIERLEADERPQVFIVHIHGRNMTAEQIEDEIAHQRGKAPAGAMIFVEHDKIRDPAEWDAYVKWVLAQQGEGRLRE